ncbi:MAG: hypothetical protein ABIR68_13625 [Ilumatobacteraceae bacterium]
MPVSTTSRSLLDRPSLRSVPDWLTVVVIGAIVLVIGVAIHGDEHIDALNISNPTGLQIEVLASTPNDATVLPITIVGPGATDEVQEIIDLGATWVLHFRTDGLEADVIQVSREEMLANPYVIPASVGVQLIAMGAEPHVP